MPRKLKFKPGEAIRTINDFDEWTDNGGWIYWFGKPKHPSILANQQYAALRNFIKQGCLKKAVLND